MREKILGKSGGDRMMRSTRQSLDERERGLQPLMADATGESEKYAMKYLPRYVDAFTICNLSQNAKMVCWTKTH
jgi:hypothetical protein